MYSLIFVCYFIYLSNSFPNNHELVFMFCNFSTLTSRILLVALKEK